MKIDINKLAEHFAHTSFRVEQVCRYARDPGMRCDGYTEPFPGFVFPLRGKAEFVFNGTPYTLAPGKVVHGGAHMQLDRQVVGNTRWEYLLVLYRICAPEPAGFCLPKAHFELTPGHSPRLTELLELLWRVSRQPGGIPVFRQKCCSAVHWKNCSCVSVTKVTTVSKHYSSKYRNTYMSIIWTR